MAGVTEVRQLALRNPVLSAHAPPATEAARTAALLPAATGLQPRFLGGDRRVPSEPTMSFAASPVRVAGTASAEVTLFGQRVFISYATVNDEHARRVETRLGAVVDHELLSVLFDLPVDQAVPRSVLTARHQRLLCRAPAGVVTRERRQITRHLVPVVRVLGVGAVGSATLTRLRRLSEFAPFATRSLAVPRRSDDDAAAEAALLGIELTCQGEVIQPGSPFVIQRHTSASWLFAEMVAAELQRVGALLAD